jgi:hypothetical protein
LISLAPNLLSCAWSLSAAMASWGLGLGWGWGGNGAVLCMQGDGAVGASSSCRIWTWGVAALCWDIRDWNCEANSRGATSTSATSPLMARSSHFRSWFPLSSTRFNPSCCTRLIWSDWSVIWLTASDAAQIIWPIRPTKSRIRYHLIVWSVNLCILLSAVHTETAERISGASRRPGRSRAGRRLHNSCLRVLDF